MKKKFARIAQLIAFSIGSFALFLGLFLYVVPMTHLPIFADEVEELQKQISELTKAREMSVAATKPLEGQLDGLKKQLAQIQVNIAGLSTRIKTKEQELQVRTDRLAYQQAILEERVRQYYIRSFLSDPLLVILSNQDTSNIFKELSYRQAATQQDQKVIASVTQEITDLLMQKEKLEKDKVALASLQVQVDKNADFIDGEIAKAKSFQSDVSKKIADLSAKQQAILAAKSGSFTVNIGDSELADDVNASIRGFRESAPSGSFAVFSFGAYTHRKGMSQYGARGRAQQGQDYKAILKAYYGKEPVSKDTGGDISVSGSGSINFEERYLYGIAEMPSSWHPEALKAQAVAARTYAYRYKKDGKEICVTESCQVFSKSKADNPPQAWKDAVNATKGQVLEDVVTFYASTHGGNASPIGWDTTDGSGGSNFIDKSYEKLGGSPWLYKAWYRKGYTNSGDTCGRGNPWLSGAEMADIVNAYLVLTKSGDQGEKDRISPITTSCWGGNPYSVDELRNVAGKYGGISSASSVSVSQGNGTTNSVTIDGVSMSAKDFYKAFSLRAPGYLRIPQNEGQLFFNIEKK